MSTAPPEQPAQPPAVSPPSPPSFGQVAIEEEMSRSYLDYAMSVIVSRALPDVRDGLKPVHRRILYAMHENGYDSRRPYRKSARIVGDVMGRYHPHGDQAIYDAMVRMAQDFSMRLRLIDGQGNFGSMDGDPPAAMRYTEARLRTAAETLLEDIDKDTVDFQLNYDESAQEPEVLPARFPNVLVNGAGGIAVGMATNIPPHNLGEVLDACLAFIDNPDIGLEELMTHIQGPDFPTGGVILGRAGIHAAYATGRGSIVIRARTHIEEIGGREAIVATEIPYQVNKSRLLEQIAVLAREGQIEGIAELRDESDRDGVRVVAELKRNAMSEVVLAQLFKHTPLQVSFGANILALKDRSPQMLTLRGIIAAFIEAREIFITRRTVYELAKARERAHILAGLLVAITNLDPVIDLIRKAADPAEARGGLTARDWEAGEVAEFIGLIDDPGHAVSDDGKYRLSDRQARAILELRLQRLTGMERNKLAAETKDLSTHIADCLDILQSRERLFSVMSEELRAMREEFADERRTGIEDIEFEHDIEDLIQREEMVVTVTNGGYIKRVPLSTYSTQRRGGKGRVGMNTREEDFVTKVFVTSTHTPVLFFSSKGLAYQMKVYKLPLGAPQALGKAMVNLFPLEPDETIATVMPMPEDEESWNDIFVMFATARGQVRRNRLADFANVRANGKIAMRIPDNERLVNVRACSEEDDLFLTTRNGMCIRTPVWQKKMKGGEEIGAGVRIFSGRTSAGVRGIRLANNEDEVISLSVLRHADIDATVRDEYLRASAAYRSMENSKDEDSEVGENGEDGTQTKTTAETETDAGKSGTEADAIAGGAIDESATGEDAVLENIPEAHRKLFEEEQFILTVTENGFGKRSSSYDYRTTGRGGKGIGNMQITERTGPVVGSFPVEADDQIILVTDGGQMIRMPVNDIRIARRRTQGVTLFRIGEDERVISVARLRDIEGSEEDFGEDIGQDPGGDSGGDQAEGSGEDQDPVSVSEAIEDSGGVEPSEDSSDNAELEPETDEGSENGLDENGLDENGLDENGLDENGLDENDPDETEDEEGETER